MWSSYSSVLEVLVITVHSNLTDTRIDSNQNTWTKLRVESNDLYLVTQSVPQAALLFWPSPAVWPTFQQLIISLLSQEGSMWVHWSLAEGLLLWPHFTHVVCSWEAFPLAMCGMLLHSLLLVERFPTRKSWSWQQPKCLSGLHSHRKTSFMPRVSWLSLCSSLIWQFQENFRLCSLSHSPGFLASPTSTACQRNTYWVLCWHQALPEGIL